MYITNCQTASGNLLYDAGNPKPVLWDNLEWWAWWGGGGGLRGIQGISQGYKDSSTCANESV